MDVATGAIGSLLPKLSQLLVDKLVDNYMLQARVRKDIERLDGELRIVHAALRGVGDVPRDQLDQQVKIWADHVRHLSYEMEDTVDKLLVRVEGSNASAATYNPVELKRLMKKMSNMCTKGNNLHEIADMIKGNKAKASELAELRQRYDVFVSPAGAATVDPRLLKELIGIDEPLSKLTEMLTDGDTDVSKQLKIVSIVGFGGLGKTTLAKAMYAMLQSQFDCGASVPVGLNPSVEKILNDILFGISKQMHPGLDLRQLINKLRGLLKNKRYFIIIDDIWDVNTWNTIKCAFVDNNCGSRIITTTRVEDVAAEAGEIYRLKPLSHVLSAELFNTRLFGGKSECSNGQLTEAYDKILHKCGGVPLAITTMASLLVDKPMESWLNVYNSFRFLSGDNNTYYEFTRKILLFSYYDLPSPLRTCLLYLSIYPEDHMIEKDSLIWKWVAEGFVHEEEGMGLYETGERYFNELINKNMIQPVERPQHDGIIIGCRVNDMVLDMIRLLANEENFVTLLNSYVHNKSSYISARRLAVGLRDDPLVSTSMHQVRSFYAMCLDEFLPSLSCFQVLRVLGLEGDILSKHNSNCLENLGKLVHLRYLGLGKMVDVLELPREIGDLKFLQTLDLGCDTLEELPLSVCHLSQLKCLRFDGTRARVPDWIGNLTSLEELLLGSVNGPSNFVNELCKLTELRKLRISGCLRLNSVKAWTKSLVKLVALQKIQVLDIRRVYFDSC